MKTIHSLTDAEFLDLFESYEHSAFRLETLQRYNVEYEREPLQHFLQGKAKYVHPVHQEWSALIKRSVSAGKTMSRVHVVEEPLTDYVRFEMLWPYADNVEAGDKVFVLPFSDSWPEGLPQHDYWLFDSKTVVIMSYAPDGSFAEAEYVEDPAEIVLHNYWRDAALHMAMPYQDYICKPA